MTAALTFCVWRSADRVERRTAARGLADMLPIEFDGEAFANPG